MLKSFTFHEGWKDVLSRLPAQVRLEVYDAIMEYGLSGTLTKLKATAELAFAILKNDIDADNHRAESIRRKRSAAGKRHKGNQYSVNGTNGTSVPTEWNKCSKTPLNTGVSEGLKNGTNVPNTISEESTPFPPDEENPPKTPKEVIPPISPKEDENKPKRARKIFVKPTVEEMRKYITEKGYALDAQQVFDHYEMVGWVYGKSRIPIKDWKAAIRTWATNDKRYNHGTTQANQGPGQGSDHPTDSELREQSERTLQRRRAKREARQAEVRDGGLFPEEGES